MKGKTTLASKLIEVLLDTALCPVLFFYCKHNIPVKNTFSGVLRALIAQLSSKDQIVASHMYDICCTRDHAGVLAVLEETAEVIFDSQATIFIVLDGVDECESKEVEKILSFFTARQTQKAASKDSQFRLLCVSQRTSVIPHMLSRASQISLENTEHEGDVKKFIEEQANSIRNEFDISIDLEREIVERVSKASKSLYSHSRKYPFLSEG